jgi:hypothetical protein
MKPSMPSLNFILIEVPEAEHEQWLQFRRLIWILVCTNVTYHLPSAMLLFCVSIV